MSIDAGGRSGPDSATQRNAKPVVTNIESPAPRRRWAALLNQDQDALLEQGPKWVDALNAAGGWHDCSRLYDLADGRSFVLPLVRRRRNRLGPQTGFAAACGIGGIVGPGLDSQVVELIDRDLAELDALWVQVRPNPTQGHLWARVSDSETRAQLLPRRAHVIDLAGSSEEVFARFSSSGRRNVRRAKKLGVTTQTFLGGDQLDVYYQELFLPSVARWASQQREPLWLAMARAKRRDPRKKLAALGDSLGDSFRLTMAYVDGRPAAGNIVIEGPNAHYTRGAMNDLAAKTDAVYLALWIAIEHACGQGHRWFHMGESGTSKTMSAYKKRFGATAYDYAECRHERLPIHAVDRVARNAVKRLIGFKDE